MPPPLRVDLCHLDLDSSVRAVRANFSLLTPLFLSTQARCTLQTDVRQTPSCLTAITDTLLFCILLTFMKCILYLQKSSLQRGKCSIWKDWRNRIGGCNFAVDKEHGHNTLLYGVDACALTKAVYVQATRLVDRFELCLNFKQAVREAATICLRPCGLTFAILILKVVFESRNVGYLYANFSLPRALFLSTQARCTRQTDVRQTPGRLACRH